MKLNVQVLGRMNVARYVDMAANFDKKSAFTRSGNAVETSARLKAPHRTGHLRRNIVSEATEEQAEIGVNLNVVPYARAIEFGSAPHWTSVKNLEAWANEKGINPYALQHSIANKGTQAHPYLRPGLASRREAIIAIFKDEISKSIKGAIK